MSTLGHYVTSIGLVTDIVGAALIFKHGIPADLLALVKTGVFVTIDEDDPRVRSSLRTHKNCAEAGLACLMVGFALQLIGNWV